MSQDEAKGSEQVNGADISAPLSESECAEVRAFTQLHGLKGAAELLNLSQDALLRVGGGLRVQRGTNAVVRTGLRRLGTFRRAS